MWFNHDLLRERIQGEAANPDDVHYEEVVCDCEQCSHGTRNKCQRQHRPESDHYIYELAENPGSHN